MTTPGRTLAWIAAGVALCWVLAAVTVAATGPYSIDELVYLGMIDAFSGQQTLAVANGFPEFDSPSLKLWILIEHAGQLYPQYPSGWAIIAAPAYAIAGARGVIILNAIAAAGTVWLTWFAARSLLRDDHAAGVSTLFLAAATFIVDYALGIWPHAASALFVTAAFASIARGSDPGREWELQAAATAGLAIGVGLNIRVDAVIAAAPLAIWMLATYRRPYAAFAALLAGMCPGLLVSAALNLQKFGFFSPITYGKAGASGGATSLVSYAPLVPILTVAALAALALGVKPVRRAVLRPRMLLLLTAVLAGAAFLLPQVGKVLWRVVSGVHVLALDFQSFADIDRPEVVQLGDGSLRLWGLVKKSLLHSMPFLAGILVLGRAALVSSNKAALWLCMLFCAAWVVPFAFSQFHGGLSNNMRYLLPMLPPVSILAAAAWQHVARGPLRWRAVAVAGVVVLLGVSIAPHMRGQTPDFIWEYAVPGQLAAFLAVLSVVCLLREGRSGHEWVGTLWQGVFAAAVLVAMVSAYCFDLSVSQSRRDMNEGLATLAAELPPKSLVVTAAAESAGLRLNRPGQMTSQADWNRGSFDARLIEQAFDSGWNVFVQGSQLAKISEHLGIAATTTPVFGIDPGLDFFRIDQSSGSDSEQCDSCPN